MPLFFDKNKQKIESLAQSALKSIQDGNNPDYVIKQIAQEFDLGPHMKQRVIEEVNIQMFLDKLSSGTQHEQYNLATPVIDECEPVLSISMDTPMSELKSDGMEKAASYGSDPIDEASMYTINDPIDDFGFLYHDSDTVAMGNHPELEKAASEIFDEVFDRDELTKAASVKIESEMNESIQTIAKTASYSAGLCKYAAASMAKNGLEGYVEDMLQLSKFSMYDLLDVNVYDDAGPDLMEKMASVDKEIEKAKVLAEAKKNLSKRDLAELGRKLFSKKNIAIASLLGGIAIGKGLSNEDDVKAKTDIASYINQ